MLSVLSVASAQAAGPWFIRVEGKALSAPVVMGLADNEQLVAAMGDAPATVLHPDESPAYLQVLLPNAEGDVWLNDIKMTATGAERLYRSPPLEPGTYTYRVKVAYLQGGNPVTTERTVEVSPSKTAVADFR